MSPPPIWPALSPSRYPALKHAPFTIHRNNPLSYTNLDKLENSVLVSAATLLFSSPLKTLMLACWWFSLRHFRLPFIYFVALKCVDWAIQHQQWKWTNGLVSALTGLVWSVPSINPTGQMASVPHDWRKNHFSCLPENCEGPCPASSYWKLSYTHDT